MRAALAGGGTGVVLLLLPGLVLFVLAVVAARLLAPLLRAASGVDRAPLAGAVAARAALARAVARPRGALGRLLHAERRDRAFRDRVSRDARARRARAGALRSAGAVRAAGEPRAARRRAGSGTRSAVRVARPDDAGAARLGLRRRQRGAATSRCSRCRPPRCRASTAGAPTSPTQTPSELARADPPGADAATARHRATARRNAPHRPGRRRTATRSASRSSSSNRRGDFSTLSLGRARPRRARASPSRIPPAARGGKLVAVRLSFPVIAAFVAGHKESGTGLSVSDAATGVLHSAAAAMVSAAAVALDRRGRRAQRPAAQCTTCSTVPPTRSSGRASRSRASRSR